MLIKAYRRQDDGVLAVVLKVGGLIDTTRMYRLSDKVGPIMTADMTPAHRREHHLAEPKVLNMVEKSNKKAEQYEKFRFPWNKSYTKTEERTPSRDAYK